MPKLDFAQLLMTTIDRKASDLHLTVGDPPMLRVHGSIVPIDEQAAPLTQDELHASFYDILTEDQRKRLERDKELDFALELKNVGRFRANVFYTRRGEGAAFRYIPSEIRTMKDLGLPEETLKDICNKKQGLVIVTGPTGSGKSTTLAAMVDYINSTRNEHIITTEDPIEFIHEHKNCIVNQREVGSSTHTFANALRSALREDPDVILVGEMRDLETISLALTAAETGHLVFATLHTISAPKTVDRVIDVFPPGQQPQIRTMFAEVILAVISQVLLKKKDGRRPDRRAGDHDRNARHQEPDPGRQGPSDHLDHPDLPEIRHAEHGPGPQEPGHEGAGRPKRSQDVRGQHEPVRRSHQPGLLEAERMTSKKGTDHGRV